MLRKYCTCKNETQKHLLHEELKKLRNDETFQFVNLRMNTLNSFFYINRNNTVLIWKGIRQLITLKFKSKFIQILSK